MRTCVDCKLDKDLSEFRPNKTFCNKCHYQRYKDRPRVGIIIQCPLCFSEREMRIDAWKIWKTDMCRKCSPLHNEQLLRSSHGLPTKHPLYIRWCSMKQRCKDVHKRNSYLDKHITVCDDWLNYAKFYEWSINNGFDTCLELDRIDASKGYSPDNCQWITHKENTAKIEKPFGKDPNVETVKVPKMIVCECGCELTRGHLLRHKRTPRHQELMQHLENKRQYMF